MRNIIRNTLIAATLLTSVSAQAVTWNSDYGVITELTADHIEFIKEHRSSNSGVLAGFVWTKVGDEVVSMKVSEVRDAGNKVEAKKVFINKVIETIVEKEIVRIEERIVEIATTNPINAENVAEIARLQGIVTDLENKTLVFGSIASDILNDSNLDNYNPVSTGHDSAYDATTNWLNLGQVYVGENNINNIGRVDANAIDSINQAIDFAFNQGFSEGYDAGYTDGYTDGFADGQSSVTISQ